MALTQEQIKAEVEKKSLKLISATGYRNMNSDITVECEHGHQFITTINTIRGFDFECPMCGKKDAFKNPNTLPEKRGYRLIAFDQATERFGVSVWDDGELVFFNLYTFSGLVNKRLCDIEKFIDTIVLTEWKPDFIVMEDIQYQHGAVVTYKILAMLLGVIEVCCMKHGINYEVVSPNVWRKYAGTCGKTRTEEKQLSVATVWNKYQVKVSDDVAEAILIGSYGVKTHKNQTLIHLCGKK